MTRPVRVRLPCELSGAQHQTIHFSNAIGVHRASLVWIPSMTFDIRMARGVSAIRTGILTNSGARCKVVPGNNIGRPFATHCMIVLERQDALWNRARRPVARLVRRTF